MHDHRTAAGHTERRQFLRDCGMGLGRVALAALLAETASGRASAADPLRPLAPRQPPLPARAKRVIQLFMAGGPSHLELFDSKPELAKLEGKPLPESIIGSQRFAFIRPDASALGPRFPFARYGQCGAELSDRLPHLAKVVDDLCIIKSMRTDQFNHTPAQLLLTTGFAQPGRPSMGSWVLYALGAETQNLPGHVVMSTGGGISGGSANWSSGFMPTVYTGCRFRNQGDPILDTSTPAGVDARLQGDSVGLVQEFDRYRLESDGDPEIATRMAAYDMAFRLQSSAPELMDLSMESAETKALYGCDPAKPSFARACLLARRMLERGVRFVTIYHAGWDAHSDVTGNHKQACAETDQASAALVTDLKRRGLLDDTLVIWGGEFGRTPMVESNAALGRSLGRDHHPSAFSMWMAGGGMKRGVTIGATDDLGYHVVKDPIQVHDLQATILHLLGLDHERLTYRSAGRDFRLTDVDGRVMTNLLA